MDRIKAFFEELTEAGMIAKISVLEAENKWLKSDLEYYKKLAISKSELLGINYRGDK